MDNRRLTASALAGLVVFAGEAAALINPNFTPVDLVSQSKAILRLEVGPPGPDGRMQAKVLKVLQGKGEAPALIADRAREELGRNLGRAFGQARTARALMFAGDFSGASDADAADESRPKPVAMLHVETFWFALYKRPDGALLVSDDPLDLKAVWAGGDEMLVRAIEYIQADSRADVPATAGVRWGDGVKAATVGGKVHGCIAVSLDGSARRHLLVMSEGGDRLLAPAGPGAKLDDVTAKGKLASRSVCAAWGDFNSDGRLDLASWDGKALTVSIASADGTFQARPVAAAIGPSCLHLAAVPAAAGGAALLVSTPAAPVLVTFAKDGSAAAETLGDKSAEFAGKALGQAGPCLAADFDADGLVDVLQPLAKGVLLYRSTKAGAFAPAVKACEARMPGGLRAAAAGDWDADGLPDVVLGGAGGCFVLANLGGGRFREVVGEGGEVAYISKPNVVDAAAFDINNDGRQEFILLYANMGPLPFFNRGFRCFGYATTLELRDSDLDAAGALMDGQQAGAVADFNADGAQDVAMVSTTGDVWLLLRQAPEGAALSLTVTLPPGLPGPVNVIGIDGKRPLGARVIAPGGAAFFGKQGKGPIDLQWRLPGQPGRTTRVVILKPMTMVLPYGQ